MSSRFQLEGKTSHADPVLVDPEAYDATEQQFAASLEGCRPRFVVSQENEAAAPPSASARLPDSAATLRDSTNNSVANSAERDSESLSVGSLDARPHEEPSSAEGHEAVLEAECPHAWRNEVAARLDRYRAKRRPREPRYPSLQLKFNTNDDVWASSPALDPSSGPEQPGIPADDVRARAAASENAVPRAYPEPGPAETTARIIPFPRYDPPPPPQDELAEPVLLIPRILEAPEEAQPQPALGGILIEPAEESNERRPGIEVPIQPAPMPRRILATAIDMLLVLVAVGIFGYIFLCTSQAIPPAAQLLAMTLLLAGVLWPVYQYVLLVYAGATPGLKLAKLRLSRFNSGPVPRSRRRWRVLASALSGISLGLGYAWSILDEDQLCWHDRITETYMAPKSSP